MNEPHEHPAAHVEDKRAFYGRVAVFAAIAAGLWIIWAVVTDDKTGTPWPIWPTLGMGVAVAIDAWRMFGADRVR